MPPSVSVPFFRLDAIHNPLRKELLAQMERVTDSGQFILGEDVAALEQEVARYCQSRHAIGCASGSDALILALLALGIGPGDKVATTPFTFFATAGAISRVGAVPVFADIDPATYNLAPSSLEELLKRTHVKAVIVVHLYGGCADMDPILALARRHGCAVIEDAAQAIGADYRGRRAMSLADIGCVSFFPTKNLGAFGDAGLLTVNDDRLARQLRMLRVHGSAERYRHDLIGVNSRLDSLQAAVLRVKLRYLDQWTGQRQRNATRYQELLAGCGLELPSATAYQTRHVYNQFVVRSRTRDRLRQGLRDRGVGTEVYYPIPLHLQPCYADLGYRKGDLPESERAADQVLALPVYPGLSEEDIEYVSSCLRAGVSAE